MSARLPPPAGLLIDRARPLRFRFEGRAHRGFAGDSLASALYANGVRTLSRSFKYHRPRGPLTMAGNDANTLVRVGGDPATLADRVALSEGLEAFAINTWGGLKRDRLRFLDRLGALLPVGFYYKSFFRPRGAWRFWEPLLRHLAGLGAVDMEATRRLRDSRVNNGQ